MSIGSKILVYSNDPAENKRIVRLLMYQKFVLTAVDSISYAKPALESGEYPIFMCGYLPEDQHLLDLLKYMRHDPQMRAVVPIIVLNDPTQESVSHLIKIGYSNFILQNSSQQIFIDKVEAVAQNIGDIRDKREYPRIEIPDFENAQLLITARNGNKYPVRISNISMGGLQITWSAEKMPVQRMVTGDTLVNCLLVAKNLDLYVDLNIVSVFNYKAGTKFNNLNEERQTKLCNFIYERLLAENVKELESNVASNNR
jgi:hypothetical protein